MSSDRRNRHPTLNNNDSSLTDEEALSASQLPVNEAVTTSPRVAFDLAGNQGPDAHISQSLSDENPRQRSTILPNGGSFAEEEQQFIAAMGLGTKARFSFDDEFMVPDESEDGTIPRLIHFASKHEMTPHLGSRRVCKALVSASLFIGVSGLKIINVVALFFMLSSNTRVWQWALPAAVVACFIGILLLLESFIVIAYHYSRRRPGFLQDNHLVNRELARSTIGLISGHKSWYQWGAAIAEYQKKPVFRSTFTLVEFLFALNGLFVLSFLWKTKASTCTNLPDEAPQSLSESIYEWSWTDGYVPMWLEVVDFILLTINTLHPLNSIVDTRAEKAQIFECLTSTFFWISRFNQPIILLPLSIILSFRMCMLNPYVMLTPIRVIVLASLIRMGSWTQAISRGNRNTEIIIFNAMRVFCLFVAFATLLMLIEFNPQFARSNESVMGESFIASTNHMGYMHGGIGYYLYFSIIVATTVGLGDIHPVTIQGQAITAIFVIIVFANVPRVIDSYNQARIRARLLGYLPYSFQRRNTLFLLGPIVPDVAVQLCAMIHNCNDIGVASRHSPISGVVFICPEEFFKDLASVMKPLMYEYNFGVSLVKGDFHIGEDNRALASFLGKVEQCRGFAVFGNIALGKADGSYDVTPVKDTIFRLNAAQFFLRVPVSKCLTTVHTQEETGLLRHEAAGRVTHLTEIKAAILAASLLGTWGLGNLLLPLLDYADPRKAKDLPDFMGFDNFQVCLRYFPLPEGLVGKTFGEAISTLYHTTQIVMMGVYNTRTGRHEFLFTDPNDDNKPEGELSPPTGISGEFNLGPHHLGAGIGRHKEFSMLQDAQIKFQPYHSKTDDVADSVRVLDQDVRIQMSARAESEITIGSDAFQITKAMTLRDTEMDEMKGLTPSIRVPEPGTPEVKLQDAPPKVIFPATNIDTDEPGLFVASYQDAYRVWIYPNRPFIFVVGLACVSTNLLDFLIEARYNILVLTCGQEVSGSRNWDRYLGYVTYICDRFRSGSNVVSTYGLNEAEGVLVGNDVDSHSLFNYNLLYLYASGNPEAVLAKKNRMVLVLNDQKSLDYFHDRSPEADYFESSEFTSGRAFVNTTLWPLALQSSLISPILSFGHDAIIRHLLGLDIFSDSHELVRIQRSLNKRRIRLHNVGAIVDYSTGAFAANIDHPDKEGNIEYTWAYGFILQRLIQSNSIVMGALVVEWNERNRCYQRRVLAKPHSEYRLKSYDQVYVFG